LQRGETSAKYEYILANIFLQQTQLQKYFNWASPFTLQQARPSTKIAQLVLAQANIFGQMVDEFFLCSSIVLFVFSNCFGELLVALPVAAITKYSQCKK